MSRIHGAYFLWHSNMPLGYKEDYDVSVPAEKRKKCSTVYPDQALGYHVDGVPHELISVVLLEAKTSENTAVSKEVRGVDSLRNLIVLGRRLREPLAELGLTHLPPELINEHWPSIWPVMDVPPASATQPTPYQMVCVLAVVNEHPDNVSFRNLVRGHPPWGKNIAQRNKKQRRWHNNFTASTKSHPQLVVTVATRMPFVMISRRYS